MKWRIAAGALMLCMPVFAVIVGVASGVAVTGYLVGRALDKRVTRIVIIP